MRRQPTIARTAFAAFANSVAWALTFGALGALLFCLALTAGTGHPELVPIYVSFGVSIGAIFGLAVGILVGTTFAILVVIADRRGTQVATAGALPWVALGVSEIATVALSGFWPPILVFLTPLDAVFTLYGARRIATGYLAAEEPKIRQLVH